MLEPPVGTITFLITDIEGSTQRWEKEPEIMRIALAEHDAVLIRAIEANGGWAFKNTGDGVLAAFSSAPSAIEAAIAAQRELELPVRMSICTGEAELRADNYFGPTLNRAARTMSAGHSGQVLVDVSTAALVQDVELVDLGVHRLRDLSQPQRLYQVRAEGLKSHFPALKTLDVAPGNLPTQTTSFLGREGDLAALAVLLRGSRLVTLTGVGGVGKTRLALQVAAEISADYPDGAWLVELAAVGDPDATEHAVAGVLGIAQQSGKTVGQSIVASLARRRLLLVLDNCEHLIEAAAVLAREILTRCSQVTVLATSREALMVDGEQIWPVPSLTVSDGIASPAVELFTERARAVVPQFELGSDAETVSEICRRLDGIPLAIELAAARIRVMSPAQIRSRLDDRFRLLTGSARRALDRHQTLRHAVQWSYDLLSPVERGLLARCSVFAGGFTLEAAEHVGGVAGSDVLELMDSLVRKSLVTAERSEDVMRYGLLETIRQFAEEQLGTMGEAESTRERHAQFFAKEAELHFEIWRGPEQRVSHEWLDLEIDNLRAAFRWALDHNDIESAARIGGVGEMARNRLREEAAGWSAEIADAARAIRYRRLPVLLTWGASSAWALGHWEEANRYGEEAIALAADPEFEPFLWACGDLAFIAAFNGDNERALAFVEGGARQEADHQDRMCLAHVPYFMALTGRRREARESSDEIVATVERAGLPLAMLIAYYGKGYAFADTDPEVAASAFERVAEVARDSGNLMFETMAIPQIAILQARNGSPIAALERFRVMLDAWRGTAEALLVSHGIGGLAVLFERLGRFDATALLHGMLEKAFPTNPFFEDLPTAMARVREVLGQSAFEEIAARGAAMDLHQVIDYAQGEIIRASTEDRYRGSRA